MIFNFENVWISDLGGSEIWMGVGTAIMALSEIFAYYISGDLIVAFGTLTVLTFANTLLVVRLVLIGCVRFFLFSILPGELRSIVNSFLFFCGRNIETVVLSTRAATSPLYIVALDAFQGFTFVLAMTAGIIFTNSYAPPGMTGTFQGATHLKKFWITSFTH